MILPALPAAVPAVRQVRRRVPAMVPTGRAAADGTAGTEKQTGVNTDGTLKVKIGRQINGAAVDLIEAGADPNKVLETLKDPIPSK